VIPFAVGFFGQSETGMWKELQTQLITTSVANINFSGVGIENVNELYLAADVLDQNANGHVRVSVSVNNGGAFLNASYRRVLGSAAAVEERQNSIRIENGTADGTSRMLHFHCFNFGPVPMFLMRSNTIAATNFNGHALGSIENGGSRINFIRVDLSGGNIRGDVTPTTIALYGRM
jgi:hypothetical protein